MSASRWVRYSARYSARYTARYSGRPCSAEIDRRPETVEIDRRPETVDSRPPPHVPAFTNLSRKLPRRYAPLPSKTRTRLPTLVRNRLKFETQPQTARAELTRGPHRREGRRPVTETRDRTHITTPEGASMTDIINPKIEDLRRRLADEIAAETARQESFGTEPEQGAIWWEEEDRDGKWSASCAVRRGAVWQVLKPSALLDANWSDFVDALERFRGVRRVRNVTVLPVEIDAEEGR